MSHMDRVRNIIAEALFVDLETIKPGDNLMNDHGAESIDFLDIMFRLEKEFQIEIPKGDIERRARGNLSDAEFMVAGQLTPAALANVRKVFPEAGDKIHSGLLFRELPTLFTVQTIADMVEQRLAESNPEVAATAGREPTPETRG